MFVALIAAGAVSVVNDAAAPMHFRGVVRVEREGRTLVERGYGEPPETAFWVASIAKSFTAALILRLQELGKLRLDDWIGDVTIDELLTHTSGLPRAAYAAEGIADIMPDRTAATMHPDAMPPSRPVAMGRNGVAST